MNIIDFKSELVEYMLLIKVGIQKIIEPIAKSENITIQQLCVLLNVYNENINTIGGLSKDFGMNQGNFSTLCKDLEKMGLITRMRNADDERIVNIKLTTKGKKVTERLYKKIEDLNDQFVNVSKERLTAIVKGIKEFGVLLKEMERKGEK